MYLFSKIPVSNPLSYSNLPSFGTKPSLSILLLHQLRCLVLQFTWCYVNKKYPVTLSKVAGVRNGSSYRNHAKADSKHNPLAFLTFVKPSKLSSVENRCSNDDDECN